MSSRLTRWLDLILDTISLMAKTWCGLRSQRDEQCFVNGCVADDLDTRGPVVTRDGRRYRACAEHWEAIIGIVGRQQTWQADAYRSRP